MSEWKEWPDHCYECGYEQPTHEDPRTPPLELGDEVLCDDCYCMSLEECIEEAEGQVEHYRRLLETIE